MSKKLDVNDYIGKVYGMLTILSKAEPYIKKGGRKETKVTCKCECGTVKDYRMDCLKGGSTQSCGCASALLLSKSNTIHGNSGKNRTPEYSVWRGVKERTTNSNSKHYLNYGGRGIFICSEWINSFPQFLADMGKRPTSQHSIERRDNNKGYSKDNCYWANNHQQQANRRNSNKIVGVSFHKVSGMWQATLAVNKKLVLRKYFKTERAAEVARIFAEIKHFGKPIKNL